MEVIKPRGVTTVYILNQNKYSIAGTVIQTTVSSKGEKTGALINNSEVQLLTDEINHFPVTDKHVKISMGADSPLMVNGGELGITVDLREK